MLMVLRNLNRLYQIHQQHPTDLKALVESGQLGKTLEVKAEITLARVPTIEKPFPTIAGTGPPASPTHQQETYFKAPADVSSLQDDVEVKQMFKYDPVLERQARKWIEVRV